MRVRAYVRLVADIPVDAGSGRKAGKAISELEKQGARTLGQLPQLPHPHRPWCGARPGRAPGVKGLVRVGNPNPPQLQGGGQLLGEKGKTLSLALTLTLALNPNATPEPEPEP